MEKGGQIVDKYVYPTEVSKESKSLSGADSSFWPTSGQTD